MDFGEALRELKRGRRVRRAAWQDDGAWLCLVAGMMILPDSTSAVRKFLPRGGVDLKMGAHVLMRAAQGVWEPGWTPTQADIFGEDWEVVEETA